MSFFIDETNLLESFGSLSNLITNYQPRDNSEIEEKISEKLPYKHKFSVKGSDIKVELFHSGVTDEQLAKIGTVVNDTFKVCQKYKIVPSDTNVNFRMFLFEDREQYVDMANSLYSYPPENAVVGFVHTNQGTDASIALADSAIYREPFGKINYHTLSHEFVHCIQGIAKQNNNNAVISEHVSEGMAQFVACEALHERDGHPICYTMDVHGGIIKPMSMSLSNIYNGHAKNPHTTGLAMFKFLSNRHPEIITQLSEYFLDGDEKKYQALSDKIDCINGSEEFINWVTYPSFNRSPSMQTLDRIEDPHVTNTLKFLSERHPEIIKQLHKLFLRGDNAYRSDNLVEQVESIHCSGEFQNWINDQQHHSADNII